MFKDIQEFIDTIKAEIQEIWVEEPQDIYNIRHGYLGSEAGAYGQVFSPLVMLSGEVRYLGTHCFADLDYYCKNKMFELPELITLAKRMISTDLSVIEFFGLRRFGQELIEYNRLLDEPMTFEQFAEAAAQMFILANRYQLWLHQIFPWGLGSSMRKMKPEDYRAIADKMS